MVPGTFGNEPIPWHGRVSLSFSDRRNVVASSGSGAKSGDQRAPSLRRAMNANSFERRCSKGPRTNKSTQGDRLASISAARPDSGSAEASASRRWNNKRRCDVCSHSVRAVARLGRTVTLTPSLQPRPTTHDQFTTERIQLTKEDPTLSRARRQRKDPMRQWQ